LGWEGRFEDGPCGEEEEVGSKKKRGGAIGERGRKV